MKPNREAVKVLAKAIGLREAARRMGLSEQRVMKWSQRDPTGPWIKNADNSSLSTPSVTGSTLQQACPQSVRTPSDAMDSALKDDAKQTKISLSKGIRKAATFISEQPGVLLFTGADRVKQIVGAASQLHGWEQSSQGGSISLNILTGQAAVQINTKPQE